MGYNTISTWIEVKRDSTRRCIYSQANYQPYLKKKKKLKNLSYAFLFNTHSSL